MPKSSTTSMIAKLQKQLETLKKKEASSVKAKQDRALAKISQIAKENGLTAEAVAAALKGGKGRVAKGRPARKGAGKPAGDKRGSVAPKYRNPANPEQTWAGRGKPPVWAAQMKAAGTLETALIKPAA